MTTFVQMIERVKSERLGKVLKWCWFLSLILLGIKDGNWNVFWLPVIFTLIIWWALEKQYDLPNFVQPFLNWCKETWAPVLIVMTVALFVIGNGPIGYIQNSNTQHYKVLQSPLNVRVSNVNQWTLHLPLVERVSTWDLDNEIRNDHVVATTADGKTVSAKVTVHMRLLEEEQSAILAAQEYGNQYEHNAAIKAAVDRIFAEAVSHYTLEDMPNNPLILENLIGSTVGLEGLQVKWWGDIIVTDMHITITE